MAGITSLLNQAITQPSGYGTAIDTWGGPKGYVQGVNTSQQQQTPQKQTQQQQQPATDPYAQWGGQSAFNNLVSGFNTQKANTLQSANDTANNYAKNNYGIGVQNLIDSLGIGQQGIDAKATQNELAKRNGTQGVMDMVGRGVRSGGVMLNNKNAANSSAAQGIANAYGQIGRGQLSNVNNQYEMGNQDIQTQQHAFDVQKAGSLRSLEAGKQDYVNNLINQTRAQLGDLQAQMINKSLPDRIAIDQEIAAIKQNALSALQQYDAQLNQGTSSIAPISADVARQRALEMANKGQAPANAFTYTQEAPAQFQGTGPFAADLPLFTLPRSKTQVG